MGRALFSVSHPAKPSQVQVHVEPESQVQCENWSRLNAFDPDSDEFFENAVYEAVIPADALNQIAAAGDQHADRDRQNASVGVGAEADPTQPWYYEYIRGPALRYLPPPEQSLSSRQRQSLANIARRSRSASVSSITSTSLPPLVPMDHPLMREFSTDGRMPPANWTSTRLSRGTTTGPRLSHTETAEGDDSSPDSSAPTTPNPETMSASQLWTANTPLGGDDGASPLPPPTAQLPFIPQTEPRPADNATTRNLSPATPHPVTQVPWLNIDSLSESRRRSSISDRRPSISEQRSVNQPERRAIAVPRRSMGNGMFGVEYTPASGGPLPNPNARISHTWQSASPPAYQYIPGLRTTAQDVAI